MYSLFRGKFCKGDIVGNVKKKVAFAHAHIGCRTANGPTWFTLPMWTLSVGQQMGPLVHTLNFFAEVITSIRTFIFMCRQISQ
jgi:hypothetical protein